jgi:Phage integrase, N-terminal SAM-like domain
MPYGTAGRRETMARKVGSSKLDTRSARVKLTPRREPYWIKMQRGLSLAYRRTASPDGSWIARAYDPAATPSRTYKALGNADDHSDADGRGLLTFDQAQQAARDWVAKLRAPAESDEHLTVAEACDRYLAYLKAERSVNSYIKTKSKIGKHVLPALGTMLVAALTVADLEAWKHGMVRVRDGDEGERRNKDTANRALTDLKAALNRLYPKTERAGKPWNSIQRFKAVGRARCYVRRGPKPAVY